MRTDAYAGEVRTYRQPYYLRVDRNGPVCFAGLMSTGTPEGGEPRLTRAIPTRSPSKTAAQIHDRMPVILPDAAHHEWLDLELTDAGKVGEIIRLTAMCDVKYHQVTTRLNSAKTDGEDLIKQIMEKG